MTPGRIIVIICLAEIASMLGIATFPSLQPTLIDAWGLSNIEVGWINGIYFAGYLLSVPVLVSLTDRRPPKGIYFFSMALAAASGFGFAFLAEGFWSAMLFRCLAGIGLAGTYMPGLKMLSDLLETAKPGGDHSRAVAFYTSSFGVGSALSYLIAGEAAALWGWSSAFLISGVGPVLALLIVAVAVPADSRPIEKPDTHLLDFRPVFRTPEAMGYVFAYTVHNFELFAFRSWVVSYLVFAAVVGPTGDLGWSATAIAAVVNLVGLPASVMGNELSRRIGRHRTITIIMLASAVLACLLGFAATLPYWAVAAICVVYGLTVTGDSSSITAGVVAAAPKGYRGATMAVHSSIGFIGSFMGPLAFGIALDLSSATGEGGETVASWATAFALSGLVVALGPLGLAVSRRLAK